MTLQLYNYIDYISCGDENIPSKPHPDNIFNICDKLNIETKSTIVVGDTLHDITMSKNADCKLSVGISGGAGSYDDLINNADLVINDLNKLPKILEKYAYA